MEKEPLVKIENKVFILSPEYYNKSLPGTTKEMYLRKSAYEKLVLAHNFLPVGYRFKIFDAYRSNETQKYLWDKFYNGLKTKHPNISEEEIREKTREFVSDPNDVAKLPLHCTGGAVDLTVVSNGEELDMGTSYDDFTTKSYTDYFNETKNETREEKIIIYNREILYNAMTKAGFVNLSSEWWHYDYGNWRWSEVTGYKQKF